VSYSLSRLQAVVLGLVVLAALGAAVYGVVRIADKQGYWNDTVELSAGFPEAHDVTPGTPVRLRGVDVGQVVAVEYPDHDGPGAEVTVRMSVQAKYAGRVYADASARINGSGLLGAKVISLQPGDPGAGPLAGGRVRGVKPFGVDEAVAEVRDLAKETRETVAGAKAVVTAVKDGQGSLGKLVRDDGLYDDVRDTVGDARKLLARADKTVGALEGEMDNLRGLVGDGRDTLRSVKQNSDALSKMPIVRSYVEDAAALLVRPAMKRDRWEFAARDLFEPGTATLTYDGQVRLNDLANALKENKPSGSEIVVAAFFDPGDRTQTTAAALELTKKQAEAVAAHLKACDVHKMGTFKSNRKVAPLGMGTNRSPADADAKPASSVQVFLFTPK
jgi:hypothetical protein